MGFKWTDRVYKAFGPVMDIDKEEMSILVAIAHCTNDITNAGFPSTATLGRMTHISRSTIFNRLNTLEAKGYLSYSSGGFRDGRQYANEYTIKIPDADSSAGMQPPVSAADSPRPSGGREPVRGTDTNGDINGKFKRNDKRGAFSSGAFQLMGAGLQGVLERPAPATPIGRVMDFCRLSSQDDRRELTLAALTKGKAAIEKLLAELKSTRAGSGLTPQQRKSLVLQRISLLPDEL